MTVKTDVLIVTPYSPLGESTPKTIERHNQNAAMNNECRLLGRYAVWLV
jgi:hypothetical protein